MKETNPRPGEWLGYPKGALLIIGVEFWERFSFYGMLSILALFLTGSPIHGGFGWTATEGPSLAVYGMAVLLVYRRASRNEPGVP